MGAMVLRQLVVGIPLSIAKDLHKSHATLDQPPRHQALATERLRLGIVHAVHGTSLRGSSGDGGQLSVVRGFFSLTMRLGCSCRCGPSARRPAEPQRWAAKERLALKRPVRFLRMVGLLLAVAGSALEGLKAWCDETPEL